MKCPHCSFDNSDDAPFCEGCGRVFLSGDRIPAVPDPAETTRRRDAVLGGVPSVVQVPDIDAPSRKAPARPAVPEVVPASTGPVARSSVADLVDPLPEFPGEPDFSGFERLVDSSYVPPAAVNSAGDTAEIPVVREEYVPRARNYTLGLSPREQKKRDRQQKRLERKFAKAKQKEEMRAAREEARAAADAAREERRAIAAAEREERLAAAAAAREERKAARAAGEDASPSPDAGAAVATAAGLAAAAAAVHDAEGAEAPAPADRPVLELPGAETGIVPVGERGIESVSREEDAAAEEAGLVPAGERTVAMEPVSESSGEQSLAAPGDSSATAPADTSAPAGAEGAPAPADPGDAAISDSPAASVADDAPAPAVSAAAAKAAAKEKAKAAKRASREKERAAKAAAKEKKRAARENARAAKAAPGNAAAAVSRARGPRAKWPFAVAAVVLLALIGAGVAWGTYNAELWGGKTVPAVTGLTQDEAAALLAEQGFAVEVAEEKSDEAPGTVLAAVPDGGRAEEGSTVALTVAAPRIVPAVVGLSQQEAADMLAAEGLTAVDVVEEKSNEAEGAVLAVSPEAGSQVLSTDTVTLTVAVPFTVPDVVGEDADAAKEALAAEGYEVTARWSYTEDVPEGTALSTDPEAGTQLDSGSEVTLYLAKSRGAELVALAKSFLPGARLKSADARYIIDSVKDVAYEGDDVVSYTCEAHQYEDVTLPFGKGTTRVEDDKRVTLEGTLTFNGDNEVTTADPAIKY